MEKKYITLEVVSPTYHLLQEVEWVEVESPSGSFVVAPGHSPLVSIVKKRGRIIFKKKDGGEDFIDASGGIFRVSINKASVLLDS